MKKVRTMFEGKTTERIKIPNLKNAIDRCCLYQNDDDVFELDCLTHLTFDKENVVIESQDIKAQGDENRYRVTKGRHIGTYPCFTKKAFELRFLTFHFADILKLGVDEMLYSEDTHDVFFRKGNYVYGMASQYEGEFHKIEDEKGRHRIKPLTEKQRETHRKILKSASTHPNGLERKMIKLLDKIVPDKFDFTGDSNKCPDFTSKDETMAIEVNGDYYHSPDNWLKKVSTKEEEAQQRDKRKEYNLLIVWECEFKDKDILTKKILDFVSE